MAPAAAAAAIVHVGFAAAFFYLLSFRDAEAPHEVETPVEVVVERQSPPAAKAEAPKVEAPKIDTGRVDAPKPASPAPASPKPRAPDPIQQALASPVPAPDPHPPAPPQVQPVTPPQPPPPDAAAEPPKLRAAPPEPSRAATQDKEAKPANLEPDQEQVDKASHEARPAPVPQTLATADPAASFAVPVPLPPKPDPTDRPAPSIPAKAPSEADKLAAALPLDVSALPMSFRAVLSGNGAQVSAAYKGLVYGRFSRHPEVGERARSRRLKGQVIVAFSIDDTGNISQLAVLQTSGDPAVDELGLDLIRASAPFPPPPPEAQHSFTPAFSFGE